MPKKLNYLLKTPKHVREGALNDLVDAYKVNLVKATEKLRRVFIPEEN